MKVLRCAMSKAEWSELFQTMASDAWLQAGVPILTEVGREATKKVVALLRLDTTSGSSPNATVFEQKVDALIISSFKEAETALSIALTPELKEDERNMMLDHAFWCFFRAATMPIGFAAVRAKFLAAVCADLKGDNNIARTIYLQTREDAERFLARGELDEVRESASQLRVIFSWPSSLLGVEAESRNRKAQSTASAELIQAIEQIQQARESAASPPIDGRIQQSRGLLGRLFSGLNQSP
jgi:hypothetical protein